jgi:hypothetical protein
MAPTLPLISQPLTSSELRRRVLAQLALLAVNWNGNGNGAAK